jgi:hypothetical protein
MIAPGSSKTAFSPVVQVKRLEKSVFVFGKKSLRNKPKRVGFLKFSVWVSYSNSQILRLLDFDRCESMSDISPAIERLAPPLGKTPESHSTPANSLKCKYSEFKNRRKSQASKP